MVPLCFDLPLMRKSSTLLVGLLAAFVPIAVMSGDAPALARAAAASPNRLVVDTAAQQQRFSDVFAATQGWVDKKAFPGAVIAVGQHGRLVALKSFGRLDSSPAAPLMPEDAVFDLASLTKVVATTTAAAMLVDQGKLNLDAPVVRYLPAFAATPGHDKIKVRHLLAHSSGLYSTDALWKQAKDRAGIIAQINAMTMKWEPGSHYQYRDENMMLLAEIVRHLSGQRIDAYAAAHIFRPLGMKDTRFNPPAEWLARIAPTEQDMTFRKTLVIGQVHDENAYVMGGVAGHAGLFSTAPDLARFCQMMLNHGRYGGKQLIRRATVDQFMRRQMLPPDNSYALGWDTAGIAGKFTGDKASPGAIIHTGFTGTSLYIDPERDAFIIILTNRVNPTREKSQIKEARVDIHTRILEALDR